MSKRKYKKGERIWTLEELDRQQFVFFNDKVYHSGFWKSWQYKWVLERLKNGQLFKAESTDQVVFVCHVLATGSGAISQLTVFNNAAKATDWLYDRLRTAKEDGFVIDNESDLLKDGGIDKAAILDALDKKFVSVTMFSGWQKNWDESFDIVIEVKEVVDG